MHDGLIGRPQTQLAFDSEEELRVEYMRRYKSYGNFSFRAIEI